MGRHQRHSTAIRKHCQRIPAIIDQLVARIGEDTQIRAKLRGEDEAVGKRLLVRDAQLLKSHLTKRRQFLLEQKELQPPATQPSPSE